DPLICRGQVPRSRGGAWFCIGRDRLATDAAGRMVLLRGEPVARLHLLRRCRGAAYRGGRRRIARSGLTCHRPALEDIFIFREMGKRSSAMPSLPAVSASSRTEDRWSAMTATGLSHLRRGIAVIWWLDGSTAGVTLCLGDVVTAGSRRQPGTKRITQSDD